MGIRRIGNKNAAKNEYGGGNWYLECDGDWSKEV